MNQNPTYTDQVKASKTNKPDVYLLPPRALISVAEVFTHSYETGKYEREGYLNGIPYSTLYAAALRHLLQWRGNINLDAETQKSHIAHAIANLMMLEELITLNIPTDDRIEIKSAF